MKNKPRSIIIVLIFLFFYSICFQSHAQQKNIQFEYITIEDGLSNNTVNCILQDKKGFLWFGTNNGLNKFDGYDFTNYYHEFNDSNRISDNLVYDLCEDDYGNLWIGTSNGLNLYNISNEEFYSFKHDLQDKNRLPDNCVNSLLIDKDRSLWIGTSNGLACLTDSMLKNIQRNRSPKFNVYKHNPKQSTSISSNYIKCVMEDKYGKLWISTFCDGINVYDKNSGIFKHYKPRNRKGTRGNDKKFTELPSSCIHTIIQDPFNDEIIWMGGIERLIKFNIKQQEFSVHSPNKEKLPSSFISIHKSRTGLFFLGTDGYGSYIYDEKNKKFNEITKNLNDLNGISSNRIISLFEDNSGILWIGTDGEGICKFDPKRKEFHHYLNTQSQKDTINQYNIKDIFKDLDDNTLWIATSRAGLIKYDRESGNYSSLQMDSLKNPFEDKSQRTSIISIHQIPKMQNYIWLGVSGKGLIKYDKNRDIFSLHNLLSTSSEFIEKRGRDESALFSTLFINDIKNDDDQNLWLAARFGLYKYNPKTDKFTAFKYNRNSKNSISFDDLSCLLYPIDNILWIGTNGNGLEKYNLRTNLFTNYKHSADNSGSLSHNVITCLYRDKNQNIWIGTYNGLNMFSEKELKFKRFYRKDGLPSNRIHDIVSDENNNLWICTDKGLSKFNYNSLKCKNYNQEDGISIGEFNQNSNHQSDKGELFFGGTKGFISFHPDSIKENTKIPPIVLTEFQLFNKKVYVEKESILKTTISGTNQILLNHNQNIISFKFSALNFSSTKKNMYAYKMEGVNKDWIYTDASNRLAVYTNLDPGNYIFRVKGSNNDGKWNEKGTLINIIIQSPWWGTFWAYIFYSLFLAFIFTLSTRVYLNRKELKRQLQMEHEQSEKLSKIDEIKSHFFTNISHEFRTPLTLIKGPAKQIIDESNEIKTKDKAVLIHRNAERLNKLVSQLLDLSKIEAGEMSLKTTITNLIPILNRLFFSFAPLAEKRNISLKFYHDEIELFLYLDISKVERIVNNILSNAFKFTAEKGEIVISVSKNEKYANIKISDTGIGISQNRISKIFDRFYQVDSRHTREQEGTGIGLALTKELIELHKGRIEVESKEGEGTTFIIKLPIGKNHLKPEEICDKEMKEDEVFETSETIHESIPSKTNDIGLLNIIQLTDDSPSVVGEKPLLLLVEDNKDVRNYVKGFLESKYKIEEAVDGEDGLKKSIKFIPDIIVSDIMMPKMDGYKLCEKLKTDEKTSHIPVILLTAKAAREDKIEGLEIGADDYISKPFDEVELKVRIKNLIEQRENLREHFLKEGIFNLDNKIITSIDKKFLEKSVKIINTNISNTLFGVEAFAKELIIGRTTLHKKIVSLVGQSPSELIKRIRLSKAAILLKNNSGNISETALEVGFNNPAYFSECFKKQFGLNPSEYQRKFK